MVFGALCKYALRRPALLQLSRKLNLLEYQSKILMNEYDLAVQDFRIAASVEDSENIVAAFKPPLYVIKAQVQAGGRKLGHFADGFQGGIHMTEDPSEVPLIVSKMIGNRLITNQTSADGVAVNEVMIAEAVNLKRERYLAILLDRESTCPVVVVSSEGGVNIEELARKSPSSIHREKINIDEGVTKEKANKIATALGFQQGTPQSESCAEQIIRLYKLFTDLDCLQVEVNPLGETVEGKVISLDAKFVFDSNAIYRQPRVAALAAESRRMEVEAAGPNSIPALEFAAENHGLTYIGLPSGNIGCMVNGAGLAMATLDLLSLFSGRPANFLDLGGRANQSDVAFAIKTLTADKRIRCILINIFGGIVNCKMVAQGIVEACKAEAPKVPIVVRLEGTNAVEGRGVLEAYGHNIKVATGMEEAAKLACVAVK
ncbi:unnamed protein product [Dibothriocephalus latus]|uniref:Succinyl-CoA synthetase beta chain n=1 Tax=Dibothriocephalus latus TaxID=60516 RepID=A0A3P6SWN3_DIBLA|nr:unnamed protein product [Dibothriocephalus latus]